MKNQSTNCSICKANLNNGKIFTCIKCDKKCHQLCLIYTDEEIRNFSITRCDVCRTIENFDKECQATRDKLTKDIKCHFCGKNDGFLKKFIEKKDKWTHINCIKWFTNVRLEIENGFTIFRTEKILPSSIWTEECSSCKKTVKGDFFIKCNKPQCEKYFHTRCIQNSCVEEIRSLRIFYTLYHCEEHKVAKKSGSVFSGVKTYGKNINSSTNGTTEDLPRNIKVLKDFEESKTTNQDIILKTFKPVIINDEENKINKLKIKMKFTDETLSSNGSVNGIKLHSENFINGQSQTNITSMSNIHGNHGGILNLNEKNKYHTVKSIHKGEHDINEIQSNQSYSLFKNIIKSNAYNSNHISYSNTTSYKNSNRNRQNFSDYNQSTKQDNFNKNSHSRLDSQKHHRPIYIDDEDEADCELVFSYAKCDICAKRLDLDEKEKLKQCNNCLTYYHTLCAKDFGDKLDSDSCRKCQIDKNFEEGCFVCGKFQGSMIKCDNNWVHIFCMVMLKNYFYKKHDHMFNWGLDKYKVSKVTKTCLICKASNTFTLKCPYCELTYHPYCGLKSNFDFYSIDKKVNGPTDLLNKLEISCTCENHIIFMGKKPINSFASNIEINSSTNNSHNRSGLNTNKGKENNFNSNEVVSNCNGISSINSQKVSNSTTHNIESKTKIQKSIKPMIKCKLSSLNVGDHTAYSNLISSINFKYLRKSLNNKIDFNYFLKLNEWNWNITDYFFYEVDSKLFTCMEMDKIKSETNSKEENEFKEILDEYIKLHDKNELKYNSHFENDRLNHIICEFNNKKMNSYYVAIYDTSKLSEIKLNSTYINFLSDLNNLKDDQNFIFLSKKRKANQSQKIINASTNFIFNKNLKLIEDDEEISEDKKEAQKNGNSSEISSNIVNSTNSTKVKFIIEDIDANSNSDNINRDIDLNFSDYKLTNSIQSDKFNCSKFLRKLKLIRSFKLRKRDRNTLIGEEISKSKISQLLTDNNLSIRNLDDIDLEIMIKNQMLKEVKIKNQKILENLKKKYSSIKDDKTLIDRETILNFPQSDLYYKFKSMTKWGFIKRRLMLGVQAKSVEELLKNKGHYNLKPGKTTSDKEDYSTYLKNSYDEIRSLESECCVCFYSDQEDTTPIVFCDSCNVSVHPLCYGIKEIPEGDYFCDLCLNRNKINTNKINSGSNFGNYSSTNDQNIIENFRNKKCVLCLNNNGALKRVDKNGEYWAHVTCILLSKNLIFKDFLTMDEVIGFKFSNYNRAIDNFNANNPSCLYCENSSGDLFRCGGIDNKSCNSCNRYFHFFCAYLNGLLIRFEELENKKLLPTIYCEMHIEDNNFKLVVQKELRILTYHKAMTVPVVSNTNLIAMDSKNGKNLKEKLKPCKNREEKNSPSIIEKVEKNDKFKIYKQELICNMEEIQKLTIPSKFPEDSNDFNMIHHQKDNMIVLDSDGTFALTKNIKHFSLDDSKCAVCMIELNSDHPSNSTEQKNGEDLLVTRCSKCLIKFHNKCYNTESLSINASRILCDYCKLTTRFKIPEQQGECLLCPNTGGALKKCKKKKQSKPLSNAIQFTWLHVICAKYTKEIYLNNNCYEGFHSIPSDKFDTSTCDVCNTKRGVVIKCCVKTCDKHFHAYCASIRELQREKIEEHYLFYCTHHSKFYNECTKTENFGLDINHLSQYIMKMGEDKKEVWKSLNLIAESFSNENSMMEDFSLPYVISVIKYLTEKYQGEELFYNLLKIGV